MSASSQPPRGRGRLFDASRTRALVELVESVRLIAYGRPSDGTIAGMLKERRGTCSTKHAYLALLLREHFPVCDPHVMHRVYTLTRAHARVRFGGVVANTVPRAGLVDVHRYLTIARCGERIAIDVTLPGREWDGWSSMPLACGQGRDIRAGSWPDREKRELERRHCDPSQREPFIAALTAAFGRGPVHP